MPYTPGQADASETDTQVKHTFPLSTFYHPLTLHWCLLLGVLKWEHILLTYSESSQKGMGVSHSVMSDSLRAHGLQPARLLCSWNSPGKHTGVGCHFLLQGVFLDPGIELASLTSPALAGRIFTLAPPGKPTMCLGCCKFSFLHKEQNLLSLGTRPPEICETAFNHLSYIYSQEEIRI